MSISLNFFEDVLELLRHFGSFQLSLFFYSSILLNFRKMDE